MFHIHNSSADSREAPQKEIVGCDMGACSPAIMPIPLAKATYPPQSWIEVGRSLLAITIWLTCGTLPKLIPRDGDWKLKACAQQLHITMGPEGEKIKEKFLL